jgi:MSHA biogenesis protein MshP
MTARAHRHQRGFSAALVLVVLVLLGGMLAYGVSLTSGMHSGIAQEIAQARALQAANAGLEWGRYRIRIGAAPSCTATSPLTMPFSAGAMPVTVRCTLTGTHTEGAATVRTYSLSANACMPAGAGGVCPNAAGGTDYVERQVAGNAER